MTGQERDGRGWALYVLLAALWGSSYFWIRVGVATIPPFTLIAARLLLAVVILAIVLAALRTSLPRGLRTHAGLLVLAAINIALPFALITIAEQEVDSAVASVLNATIPLMAVPIAAGVYRDERLTPGRLAGLAVGFLGVVVLVGGEAVAGLTAHVPGQLMLLGSAASYAVGTNWARTAARGLPTVVPAFLQVTYAFLLIAPVALVLEAPWTVHPAPEAIVATLWLGILGSAAAYLVYFALIAHWGSARTSSVAYALPVVGITLGVVVLEEPFDLRMLAGTALVMAGVVLINARRGSRPAKLGPAAPASPGGDVPEPVPRI